MSINLGSILTGGLQGLLGATPIGGAVQGALSAAAGGIAGSPGSIVGGSVLARSRGMLLVQAPSGKKVLVRTARRPRRHYRGGGGGQFNKLMQMAMIKAIMK